MEKEHKKIRVQNTLELFDVLLSLAVRKGREAPVLGPRILVQVKHGADVFGHCGLAGRAAGKAALGLEAGHFFAEPVRRRKARTLDEVGEKILFFTQMPALEQLGVIGRIPGHHDGGGQIKAVHQQTAGIVGRGVQRPAHKAHALGGQPVAGGVQQGAGGLVVVGAFKKTKSATFFVGVGIILFVHNGGYAPHGAAIAQHQKQLAPGVFPKGMFAGCEQLGILAFEAWCPQRAVFIEAPGQIHEQRKLLLGAGGNNGKRHG